MALSADILASVTEDRIRVRWWMEIEGLRVRYGTWTPSWSPADSGTNRPIKPWLRVPQVGGQKAEPLNGDTKGHTIAVELLDVDDYLTDLFAIHNRSTMERTVLTADITAAGVTLTVEDSSVFTSLPCDIYLDRETMRATAAPTGTTLTVVRGMYGSEAVVHYADHFGRGGSREAEVTNAPQFLHTRRLTLHEGRYNLLEADAFTFGGFIDGVEERDGLWSLSASGNLARLKAKIGTNRATGLLATGLAGPLEKSDLPRNHLGQVDGSSVQGPDGEYFNTESVYYHLRNCTILLAVDQATGATPVATFPDASLTQRRLVKIDDELIAYEDRDTVNGILEISDALASSDAGDWAAFTVLRGMVPNRSQFAELIFPLDTDSIERRNILADWHWRGSAVEHCLWHEDFTAGTDPVSVFLQILLSGGDGGTYDTLPEGWGLGLPEADVDIEGCEDLKSYVAGIDLKFAIVEPIEASKWLKENVLRPCMLFPVERLDGKLGLSKLWDRSEAVARGSSVIIDHSKILEGNPIRMPMGAAPVGELKVKINCDPGADEFWAEVAVTFGETTERYKGATQSVEIECRSVYAPGAMGTVRGHQSDLGTLPTVLAVLVGTIFDRFALQPLPTFEVEVAYNLWPLVEVGNIVRLTSTVLPNVKTGRRGISAEWCQVLEVKPNIRKSSLNIKLAYIGVHDAETRRIAPSAKVKSYTGDVGATARTKIEIYRHQFTNSAGTRNDLDEFAVGDFVRFYNSKCEPLHAADESALEIDEIDTSGVTYDIVWFVAADLDNPPGDGDFMEITDYDQQTAGQQTRFASQSDANGLLGAGGDNGHVRA